MISDPRVLLAALSVVALAFAAFGIWISHRSRLRRDVAEAGLVARLGGSVGHDSMRRKVIEARVGGWDVRLTRVETSKSLCTWIELRVSAGALGFELRPRRSQIVATLGPTAATGDADFDARMLAMSSEPERLVRILTPELRRLLLDQAEREPWVWWWRLNGGVLRGEIRGSWGTSGFDARCDLALAAAATLAQEIERPR